MLPPPLLAYAAALRHATAMTALQNALLAEEREQLQAAHARVTQANLWASALGTGRNYRTTRVRKSDEPGDSPGDVETRVVIHEPGGKSRDVSLDIFSAWCGRPRRHSAGAEG